MANRAIPISIPLLRGRLVERSGPSVHCTVRSSFATAHRWAWRRSLPVLWRWRYALRPHDEETGVRPAEGWRAAARSRSRLVRRELDDDGRRHGVAVPPGAAVPHAALGGDAADRRGSA